MFFTRNRGWRKGSVMEIPELWYLEARWSKKWKLMKRQVGIYGRYGGYDIHGRYARCEQNIKVILSRGELKIISSSQLCFPHSRLPHCSSICSCHALGGFSISTRFFAAKKLISGWWRFSVTAGCRLPWWEKSHSLPRFSGQIFLLVADHRKLSQKVSKQWLPQ